jgi:hypothetical protein
VTGQVDFLLTGSDQGRQFGNLLDHFVGRRPGLTVFEMRRIHDLAVLDQRNDVSGCLADDLGQRLHRTRRRLAAIVHGRDAELRHAVAETVRRRGQLGVDDPGKRASQRQHRQHADCQQHHHDDRRNPDNELSPKRPGPPAPHQASHSAGRNM